MLTRLWNSRLSPGRAQPWLSFSPAEPTPAWNAGPYRTTKSRRFGRLRGRPGDVCRQASSLPFSIRNLPDGGATSPVALSRHPEWP
jgi:hypothetical protein